MPRTRARWSVPASVAHGPLSLTTLATEKTRHLRAALAQHSRDTVAPGANLADEPVARRGPAPLEAADVAADAVEFLLGGARRGPGANDVDDSLAQCQGCADGDQDGGLGEAGDLGGETLAEPFGLMPPLVEARAAAAAAGGCAPAALAVLAAVLLEAVVLLAVVLLEVVVLRRCAVLRRRAAVARRLVVGAGGARAPVGAAGGVSHLCSSSSSAKYGNKLTCCSTYF